MALNSARLAMVARNWINNIMKISQLDGTKLAAAADAVEQALISAPRATKAVVVRTLASLGLCRPSSTGTESTLLKALQGNNMRVPTNFAALMGVPSNPPAPAAAPTTPRAGTAQATTPQRLNRRNSAPATFALLGGVSAVIARGTNGTVFFTDGESAPVSNFDLRDLGGNYRLIEFNAASN